MVNFLLRETVRCSETRRDIVASPDQNDVNKRQPGDCTEYGTYCQVVPCRKGFLVYLDENQADAHDADSYPCENPNDNEC
jgi:hypothetical protein